MRLGCGGQWLRAESLGLDGLWSSSNTASHEPCDLGQVDLPPRL